MESLNEQAINRQLYIVVGNEQKGPLSLEELQSLRRSGEITSETLCWENGMSDWVPVEQLAGFLGPKMSTQSPTPTYPPLKSNHRSDLIGFTLLGIIVLPAAAIWAFGEQAAWVTWGAILATAILAGIEASQLGMGADSDVTSKGKKRMGPKRWTIHILLLWMICMPAYLYRRRLYGARNLLLPGLLACSASIAPYFFLQEEIPRVDSPEVIALAERVVKENANNPSLGRITISSPVELRYDKKSQRRIARAMLNLGQSESYPIFYSVQWHNANEGEYIVYVAESENELRE